MGTVIVGKVLEFIEYPFGKGDLTSDGVQHCANISTTTNAVNVVVETKTLEAINADYPTGGRGTIVEVEMGLTSRVCAVSANASVVKYCWQARNKGGNWVDLFAQQSVTPTTAWVTNTFSGRFVPVANFQLVPFDVRFIIECNAVNEGRGATKNSSYVRTLYRID